MASKKELKNKKKIQELKDAEQKAVKYIPKTELDIIESHQPEQKFSKKEVERQVKYSKDLKKKGIKLNYNDPVYSMGNLNYQTKKK